MVQLRADVVQRRVLLSVTLKTITTTLLIGSHNTLKLFNADVTHLSVELLGERVQVEIAELVRVVKNLLERTCRVGVVCGLVVLERVDGHLARPLVRLGVDARAVQHFDVRLSAVAQRRRVDLDEAGAVDEDLGAHVAHGDELRAVL